MNALALAKATSVAVLVTLGLALAARAAEPPKPEQTSDLEKLAGQPADLAPRAYAWRSARQVQEKPEAYFIPRRLARLDTIYRPNIPKPKGAGWRGGGVGHQDASARAQGGASLGVDVGDPCALLADRVALAG